MYMQAHEYSISVCLCSTVQCTHLIFFPACVYSYYFQFLYTYNNNFCVYINIQGVGEHACWFSTLEFDTCA